VETVLCWIPCVALTITNYSVIIDLWGDNCQRSWSDTVLFVIILIYICVFLGFAYGLRDVVDGFHIKEELKYTACVGIVAVVPWYVFNNFLKHVNDNIFPFSTLALVIAITFAFVASTLWPLYRSIWQPPILDIYSIPDSVTTLRGILSTPIGVESFKRFLTKEFSVENILFYLECEEFRKKKITLMEEGNDTGNLQLVGEAQRIYSKYIGNDSPFQVNLPSLLVLELRSSLERQFSATKESNVDRTMSSRSGPSSPKQSEAETNKEDVTSSYDAPTVPTVFDPAQKNIFHLMETDSCPRYFRSDLYKEFVQQVTEKQEKKKILDEMNII